MRYTDPDGRFFLSFGFQAQAGAGVSGTIETGIKVAFSFEKGFSMGVYSTECIGAEFGISAFAGLVIGASQNEKSVETGVSQSLVIGGSCEELVGIGIDVSVDLDTQDVDIGYSNGVKGASLKIGLGASSTVGEVHVLYSTTQQISGKDIYQKILEPKINSITQKVDNFINNLESQIKNYYLEQMGELYDNY